MNMYFGIKLIDETLMQMEINKENQAMNNDGYWRIEAFKTHVPCF